jgi:hypothetical protein
MSPYGVLFRDTLFIKGMHVGYWWESQKKTNHREDQDVGGWTILRWILQT